MTIAREPHLPEWATPALQTDGPTPLYLQLAERIEQAIATGSYLPGDAIPSEHQLCTLFHVSRPTVRRALDHLTERQLLIRRQGMGTFVAKLRIEQPMGRVIGFSERMRQNGLTPSAQILEAVVLDAASTDPAAIRALELTGTDQVFRLSRIRFANGEPMLLESTHLPFGRFPSITTANFEQGSLYQFLQDTHNTDVTYIRETLEPVLLSPHEGNLLRSPAGTPGMLARIVTFDQHGAPIEHSLSLVRGDRCLYEISFAPGEGSNGGGWHIRQTQLELQSPMTKAGTP